DLSGTAGQARSSAARSVLPRDIDQLIESQAAGGLAAAGLPCDAEPQHRASIAPARALVGLNESRTRAWDLLFVNEVRGGRQKVEPLAQQHGPRLYGLRWNGATFHDSRQRGTLKLDRAIVTGYVHRHE